MFLLMIGQGSTGTATLAQRLGNSGFRPDVVQSVSDAVTSRVRGGALAVLLDQGQTAPLAQNLITSLRRQGLTQPIVVLSGRDDWRERVASFEAGADDFLIKPVHSEEVAARLRAAIRRTMGASSDHLKLGPLEVDLKGQCAWLDGRCLELTRNEYRLLGLLTRAPDGVVTRDAISQSVWPDRAQLSPNAIEVLVARLRAKLGSDHIQTLRGMGYRLSLPDREAPEAPLAPCRGR